MIDIPQLIGQDGIREFLESAVNSGRIPHALIISGQEGSGRLAIAKSFAQSILDSGMGDNPNIKVLDLTLPKTKYMQTIKEEVVNKLGLTSFHGSYMFYIIYGANLMPKEAQNALLKSLEEPPEHAVIIMITDDAGKLLPTIRSRAVKLSLQPVDKNTIKKELLKRKATEREANMCIGLAQGNLMRAISLLEDDEYLKFVDTAINTATKIAKKDPIANNYEEITFLNQDFDKFLELMEILFRDVLIYKSTGQTDKVNLSPRIDSIKNIAGTCSFDRIGLVLKRISDAHIKRFANVKEDVLMELIMLEIGGNIERSNRS